MRVKLYLKSFLVFMFLTTIISSSAWAQDRKVSGKVSDSGDNSGVPGASVVQKGTKRGVIADVNGNFSIDVTGTNPVLIISFVGYGSKEVVVGNQSTINVSIGTDESVLDEVVVTGYQIENRKEITGAVSTVKAKVLNAVPSGNIEQQLQGKVPGLTVITNGQPGTDSKVRIRGFGAFGGNEPLYIIDGVPMASSLFLPPSDIENVTVLKDAAAASIYGARAANGVIVISTRKGVKGAKKLNITYDGVIGTTDPGKGFSVMNPQDQANWTWTALKNAGITPSSPQYGTGATPVLPTYILDASGNSVNGSVDMAAQQAAYNIDPTSSKGVHQLVKANISGTDWWKAVTRMAPLNRHALNFTGAGDNSRYSMGISYQNQAGIFIFNNFQRYALRLNTEFDLTKKIRIGENLGITYSSVRGQQGGNSGQDVANSESDVLSTARMSPIIPIYDEFGGFAGTRAKGFNNARNPVASRTRHQKDKNYSVTTLGNVFVEYDIIPNLTLRSTFGGRYTNFFGNSYDPQQYENSENNSSYTYQENYGYQSQWNFTNTAAYRNKFGKHAINAIVGTEALNTGLGLYGPGAAGRGIFSSGLNPFSTDPNFVNMSTVGNKVVNSYSSNGVSMFSIFGKADYIFDDKYIFSATVRRDGSSSFGSNNRYGIFPAFSAAWRISSEPFMKDLRFISDLKIRGGWGQMGNAINVPTSNQYNLFGQGIGISAYDINGSNTSAVTGFYRSQIGNANAKWETNTTANIGFDGSLWNGKVEVVFDYWVKNTSDLLFKPFIPGVIGIAANAPYVNVGKMLNKGVDLMVTHRGKIAGDFSYEATWIGSFLKNEIKEMDPTTPYIDIAGPRSGTVIRNQAGHGLSEFFGYKVLGLFQSASDVSGSAVQDGAAPGRLKFADINGDGKITADDRTFIGSPIPKFTGGLNFTVKYKAFDLTTYLYTSLGNKIYNYTRLYSDFYPLFPGAAINTRVANSWSPSNTGATIPIFENVNNFSTIGTNNSYYVENGSYLRMQNLQLAYNVPTNFLKVVKVEKARVYVQATNIFTITKYAGLDPGVGGSADTNFGLDIGNYPMTRGYNLGVNISF